MERAEQARLERAGIRVEELLDRFLGQEALAMQFLLRFPEDDTFAQLKQGLDQGNGPRAFQAAHTWKGVVGNLSMESLYRQVEPLVEELRAGDWAAARGRMPALEAEYGRICAALARWNDPGPDSGGGKGA